MPSVMSATDTVLMVTSIFSVIPSQLFSVMGVMLPLMFALSGISWMYGVLRRYVRYVEIEDDVLESEEIVETEVSVDNRFDGGRRMM